ncbi:MAG: hypothetical protein K9N23_07875 [Akkermansiaceae bacterium]|nr:hypothetical protein [Akkermansiaceae bacterium]
MEPHPQRKPNGSSLETILAELVQRLLGAATAGPALNARPHHSRQRLDLMELAALGRPAPEQLVRDLIASGTCELPASVPPFDWPSAPQVDWPAETTAALEDWRHQQKVLEKLRNLAADAATYQEDHGENVLAIGFPLLSVPPAESRRSSRHRQSRILAPLAFLPLTMRVRSRARPGLTLNLLPPGPGRLVPNELLCALLERESGTSLDWEDYDDDPADPWLELGEIIRRIRRVAGTSTWLADDWDGSLLPVPRSDALPADTCLLAGAVLGLFPMHQSGVLRDLEWMRDQPTAVGQPATRLLDARALRETTRSGPSAPTIEANHHLAAQDETRLVAPADPSQTTAVWRARHTEVLVMHGPPGTGKSQTIVNIIGDHLARGERVLFVSDKRTALDVVKNRLDALSLGHLCGVVHDAAADRNDLYRALRQQLDGLAESLPSADPEAAWQQLQEPWKAIRSQLADCFHALHAADSTEDSFHQLVARWLDVRNQTQEPGTDWPQGYDLTDFEPQRAALGETLRRAVRAGYADHPLREWPLATPDRIAGLNPDHAATTLAETMAHAAAADAAREHGAGLLDPAALALADFPQATRQLRATALDLGDLMPAADPELCARYAEADPTTLEAYQQQAERLSSSVVALVDTPLDIELFGALTPDGKSLTVIDRRLADIRKWSEARGLRRWFRLLDAGAARRALAPLGLNLGETEATRAIAFYQALRLRLNLSRELTTSIGAMPGDDTLARSWRARRMLAETLLRFAPGTLLADCGRIIRQALVDPLQLPGLPDRLSGAANRLEHGTAWCHEVLACGFLAARAEPGLAAAILRGTRLTELTLAWSPRLAGVPDLSRIQELLAAMPAALAAAASHAARCGSTWESACPTFTAAALSTHLRQRLAASPALIRLDATAMEAAWATLRELTAARRRCVGDQIRALWLERQRQRLLTGTGTRMGPAGSTLRQRLFIRGVRALRMRTMIAAGHGTEGGDPLFDLCPVWLASPATVAQIMPRAPLFDVVVFDEASQCRLEETLPVLLRAKRVVIAGDCQQLPPTRFFEAGIQPAETSSVVADEDSLFEKRQLEAEDLLSAAFNVEAEEVFLDVHYRSCHAGLIAYSNRAFYQSRLQTIPPAFHRHPSAPAIVLHETNGIYQNRTNPDEAARIVGLVQLLLDDPRPPSIGIACFNLPQRDLILDTLEARAPADPAFHRALAAARSRHGEAAFEGLFVRNLENVQGDERDVMLVSTTFGPDPDGNFRRHFGALNQPGGGRRLNVLVTRARRQIHVVTSIPRSEFTSLTPAPTGTLPGGRYHLYAYLAAANPLPADPPPATPPAGPTGHPLARSLEHHLGFLPHADLGSPGLRVDVALDLTTARPPASTAILIDFGRHSTAGDPVAWDQFRQEMLDSAGWTLRRVWSTDLFRRPEATVAALVSR